MKQFLLYLKLSCIFWTSTVYGERLPSTFGEVDLLTASQINTLSKKSMFYLFMCFENLLKNTACINRYIEGNKNEIYSRILQEKSPDESVKQIDTTIYEKNLKKVTKVKCFYSLILQNSLYKATADYEIKCHNNSHSYPVKNFFLALKI